MQQMDYNTILELYDYLNYFSNELLTCINNIKNIVNDLDKNEHWDGNGYKEYNEKMSNLSANFSAYISDVYDLNKVLKTSAENFQSVDSQAIAYLK